MGEVLVENVSVDTTAGASVAGTDVGRGVATRGGARECVDGQWAWPGRAEPGWAWPGRLGPKCRGGQRQGGRLVADGCLVTDVRSPDPEGGRQLQRRPSIGTAEVALRSKMMGASGAHAQTERTRQSRQKEAVEGAEFHGKRDETGRHVRAPHAFPRQGRRRTRGGKGGPLHARQRFRSTRKAHSGACH